MARPIHLFWLVAVFAVSCANGVEDPSQEPAASAKSDAGSPTKKLAPTETCGNGIDDDGDGLVDEDCPSSCPDSGSTPEFQPNCGTTCVPENAHEEKCSDGKDNDCDGKIDCADDDCRQAGSCGCTATETACGDGKDDDCDGKSDCEDTDCQGCTPGATRYCADPNFCALGMQTCTPARQWGACTETVALGCYGEGLSPEVFQCCIASGSCCQDTSGHSAGNCEGIDDCNKPSGG